MEDAGWQLVGPALSLQQAVVLAENEDCDCAVLDIHLDDGATSLPAAEILLERGIPFLFATGLGFPGQLPGFEGVPVLRKPYHYRSFVRAVQNIQASAG